MALQGKVAIITGGVGGFGRAFAIALLKAKTSTVCLVDISQTGQTVATQLNQQYQDAKVDYMQCDVTDYYAYKGVFDTVKKKYNYVDIVCNNAGITSLDADLKSSVTALRLNLEAVYYGTKLGFEYMNKNIEGRGGVIINIASMAAFLPIQGSMVYSGTKSGVVGLSRAAALDYEDTGVRVNALCPSFAETPILDAIPGYREIIQSMQPILPAEKVAEGFMQLVENDEVNGAVMRVTPQKGIDYYEYKRKSKFLSKL